MQLRATVETSYSAPMFRPAQVPWNSTSALGESPNVNPNVIQKAWESKHGGIADVEFVGQRRESYLERLIGS